MNTLLIITNFVTGKPSRMILDPSRIEAIEATGSGRDSGTDLIMHSGEVLQTSVWDTDWPYILETLIPSHADKVIVEFDRRDETTQSELNADKLARFNIEPYNPDSAGKTRESRRGRRSRATSTRDKSRAVETPDATDTVVEEAAAA